MSKYEASWHCEFLIIGVDLKYAPILKIIEFISNSRSLPSIPWFPDFPFLSVVCGSKFMSKGHFSEMLGNPQILLNPWKKSGSSHWNLIVLIVALNISLQSFSKWWPITSEDDRKKICSSKKSTSIMLVFLDFQMSPSA